jgi:glycosyltransferase involved in cell wall biosynthesis
MTLRPSPQAKRKLRARFDTDGARSWARRGVSASIAGEVAVQRAVDWKRTPLERLPADAVTAVIKTFERPREVRRLVRSILRVQPDLPIVVVDDNRVPCHIPGADVMEMPYNSGTSVGRNAALERVWTPYFVLLDDDFVFYRHTRVAKALAIIDAHPEIDILGGSVVNLPDFSTHDYSTVSIPLRDALPKFPPGSVINGLPVYSKVPNFFIGRTDAVRSVGWSEELRTSEHHEFFVRAFGVLTTVFDERFRILHARNPFDRASPNRVQNQVDAASVLRRIYNQPPKGDPG